MPNRKRFHGLKFRNSKQRQHCGNNQTEMSISCFFTWNSPRKISFLKSQLKSSCLNCHDLPFWWQKKGYNWRSRYSSRVLTNLLTNQGLNFDVQSSVKCEEQFAWKRARPTNTVQTYRMCNCVRIVVLPKRQTSNCRRLLLKCFDIHKSNIYKSYESKLSYLRTRNSWTIAEVVLVLRLSAQIMKLGTWLSIAQE